VASETREQADEVCKDLLAVLGNVEIALTAEPLRWWTCHACGCLTNEDDAGCPSCRAWLTGVMEADDGAA
jgi:rubrerythrin